LQLDHAKALSVLLYFVGSRQTSFVCWFWYSSLGCLADLIDKGLVLLFQSFLLGKKGLRKTVSAEMNNEEQKRTPIKDGDHDCRSSRPRGSSNCSYLPTTTTSKII
jgi:hypothetical protein